MTIQASHCEAILRGMSKQANKDGDWIEVKFQVHPQEVPQALWDAALRSRWQLAFVEIDDNEQPVQPKRKPAETRFDKSCRLCGVLAFQQYVHSKTDTPLPMPPFNEHDYSQCSDRLKRLLRVESKRELDSDPEAGKRFDMFLAGYDQATNRMAEQR